MSATRAASYAYCRKSHASVWLEKILALVLPASTPRRAHNSRFGPYAACSAPKKGALCGCDTRPHVKRCHGCSSPTDAISRPPAPKKATTSMGGSGPHCGPETTRDVVLVGLKRLVTLSRPCAVKGVARRA